MKAKLQLENNNPSMNIKKKDLKYLCHEIIKCLLVSK